MSVQYGELPDGVIRLDGGTVELPKVGSLIELDGRRVGERLVACEDVRFAPFRFPSAALKAVTGCVGPACRVEITGRTVQLRVGGCWVRVKVVFVGDGDPDTEARGWMRTHA